MAVREDCRHYVMRTVRSGDRVEKCRLGAGQMMPFACPEDCLFYEPRRTSAAGWHVGEARTGQVGQAEQAEQAGQAEPEDPQQS